MRKTEATEDVRRWFAGVSRNLWLVAIGSLSLRRGSLYSPELPRLRFRRRPQRLCAIRTARKAALLRLRTTRAGGARRNSERPTITGIDQWSGCAIRPRTQAADLKRNTWVPLIGRQQRRVWSRWSMKASGPLGASWH